LIGDDGKPVIINLRHGQDTAIKARRFSIHFAHGVVEIDARGEEITAVAHVSAPVEMAEQ
jgi:hypothetical protein